MNKKVLNIGLSLFLLISIAPFIQHIFSPFKLVGLTGAFEVTEKPIFNVNSFTNGKYQNHADYYIKDNAPFKGDLVRLRNQINYSFFNEINTSLSLGIENYLFDPNYINAYSGIDLLPDSQFKKFEKDLNQSIKLLKKIKVPVIFCIAPNKARFYNEFLPAQQSISSKTNQSTFLQILKNKQIPVIDFDEWFIQQKDKSKYALIPKYGAHWSTYGAYLAADSLLKTISKINKYTVPLPKLVDLKTNIKAKYSDDDYLASLNLIWKWKSSELAYPELLYSSGNKINILTISDSFVWNWYDIGLFKNVAAEPSQTWYYNKSKYDVRRNKIGSCSSTINVNDINKRDVIIIVATAPSMVSNFYSFFSQLSTININ